MNYIQSGRGQPVILLHGLADTCHDWDYFLARLSTAGYTAFAPDLPGHGESPRAAKRSEYTIDYLMASLESWIAHLDLKKPFRCIGHSLGGYLCLEYARRCPQACRQLVLINPLYTPRQIFPFINQLLQKTTLTEKALQAAPTSILAGALRLTPLVRAPIPAHLCQQKAQDFKRADPAVMRIPGSIVDLSPWLATIQAPTCVIWGKNDLTLNPVSFLELVENLPVALAKPLERTGHQPHIQRSELVANLILDFFSEDTEV